MWHVILTLFGVLGFVVWVGLKLYLGFVGEERHHACCSPQYLHSFHAVQFCAGVSSYLTVRAAANPCERELEGEYTSSRNRFTVYLVGR